MTMPKRVEPKIGDCVKFNLEYSKGHRPKVLGKLVDKEYNVYVVKTKDGIKRFHDFALTKARCKRK